MASETEDFFIPLRPHLIDQLHDIYVYWLPAAPGQDFFTMAADLFQTRKILLQVSSRSLLLLPNLPRDQFADHISNAATCAGGEFRQSLVLLRT